MRGELYWDETTQSLTMECPGCGSSIHCHAEAMHFKGDDRDRPETWALAMPECPECRGVMAFNCNLGPEHDSAPHAPHIRGVLGYLGSPPERHRSLNGTES